IINGYAREAGVRNLEGQIKKIMRKVAVKVVREQETHPSKGKGKTTKKAKPATPSNYRITPENLTEFLGKPIFTSDRFYERTPVGVCMGLAWTALGGATLYVEAIKTPAEKAAMKLTGQAGNVMKESSEIAWSYLNSSILKYAPGYTFFE